MQILIVGGGEVGSYLANLLFEQGHSVTVVELRQAAMSALQRAAPVAHSICGDGTDPDTLEQAGIRTAGLVVAVTGTDTTNLVVTSLARFAFAAAKVVARINNPHNSWMFSPEMGVDVAINQADVLAHLTAQVAG
jgi:trk system potassium uptake protein